MKTYEQVGARIRERLFALGYKRADGEPDVQRFCWDQRFDKTLVYAWLRDTMTPFKDLIRLCTALDCSAEWLLTGAERGKAMPRRVPGRLKKLLLALTVGAGAWLLPSGSGDARALSVALLVYPVHLIGRLFRKSLSELPEYPFTLGIAYAA